MASGMDPLTVHAPFHDDDDEMDHLKLLLRVAMVSRAPRGVKRRLRRRFTTRLRPHARGSFV